MYVQHSHHVGIPVAYDDCRVKEGEHWFADRVYAEREKRKEASLSLSLFFRLSVFNALLLKWRRPFSPLLFERKERPERRTRICSLFPHSVVVVGAREKRVYGVQRAGSFATRNS